MKDLDNLLNEISNEISEEREDFDEREEVEEEELENEVLEDEDEFDEEEEEEDEEEIEEEEEEEEDDSEFDELDLTIFPKSVRGALKKMPKDVRDRLIGWGKERTIAERKARNELLGFKKEVEAAREYVEKTSEEFEGTVRKLVDKLKDAGDLSKDDLRRFEDALRAFAGPQIQKTVGMFMQGAFYKHQDFIESYLLKKGLNPEKWAEKNGTALQLIDAGLVVGLKPAEVLGYLRLDGRKAKKKAGRPSRKSKATPKDPLEALMSDDKAFENLTGIKLKKKRR